MSNKEIYSLVKDFMSPTEFWGLVKRSGKDPQDVADDVLRRTYKAYRETLSPAERKTEFFTPCKKMAQVLKAKGTPEHFLTTY